MKNNHDGVLLLVKLQAKAAFLHGCFSSFLNCWNGTKSRKTSDIEIIVLIATFIHKFNVAYLFNTWKMLILQKIFILFYFFCKEIFSLSKISDFPLFMTSLFFASLPSLKNFLYPYHYAHFSEFLFLLNKEVGGTIQKHAIKTAETSN